MLSIARYNIAVILAGGLGARVGGSLPKQLRALPDGRTLLATCMDTFRACSCIDEVVVVMHPAWRAYVPDGITVIDGGKERWESSYNAICALQERFSEAEKVNVLLHDCARPYVSRAIIERVCAGLQEHEAVSVAVPVVDTIYRTENGQVRAIPPRQSMMRAQTPQGFRLSVLCRAFALAQQDQEGIAATDDAGIVLRYLPDTPVYIIMGEEKNKKITYETDLPNSH